MVAPLRSQENFGNPAASPPTPEPGFAMQEKGNHYYYFNGIGRIAWKLTFDADQTKELGYQWHYFWR
jgi:hypothetical protein